MSAFRAPRRRMPQARRNFGALPPPRRSRIAASAWNRRATEALYRTSLHNLQRGRRPATPFVAVAVRQFGSDPLEPRNAGALFFTLGVTLYAGGSEAAMAAFAKSWRRS